MGQSGFPLLAFDTETTGVSVFTDRIVSAALVEMTSESDHQVTTWLVNPGVPIPAGATNVHGITDAQVVADGAGPREALEQITSQIAAWLNNGKPLVAFNAAFDLTLLEAENRRHGIPTLADRCGGQIRPIVDPMVLDKQADKYRRGRRLLTDIVAHYGIEAGSAHSADADAIMAGLLAARIIEQNADLAAMTLDELHQAQVAWRKAHQDDLRNYFLRTGKDASSVDGSWPVRLRSLDGTAR